MFVRCLCVHGSAVLFQAEDGIRDYQVTGVQTCALPISMKILLPATVGLLLAYLLLSPLSRKDEISFLLDKNKVRSEERRVGKERRAGWRRAPDRQQKQKPETWTAAGVRPADGRGGCESR